MKHGDFYLPCFHNIIKKTNKYMANTCKYLKMQKFVSYNSGATWQPLNEYKKGMLYESDSIDCGAITTYRWYPSGYTCIGYDKWNQAIRQVSYDNGENWSNVQPEQYTATTLEETNSFECGFIPPNTKFAAKYDGGEVYSAECDSSTELTSGDTIPSGYDYNAMIFAVIGDCVTSIGDIDVYDVAPFKFCFSLKSVTIPDSVISIGRYAFLHCSSLTSVTIPSSVTIIGDEAFAYCYSLTSIDIPSGVTSIGYDAFGICSGLESIEVDANNTVYDSRNSCNAIIETSTNKLVQGCKNTVIPNTVTSISEYAFNGCSGLTSIAIPNSVTSIGDGAFMDCSSLTSIDIPSGVTSIVGHTFDGCHGLTSVTIPNSVTSIGTQAFLHCSSLTSVTIPSSVTSIGLQAFGSCTGLTSINIPSGVTTINEGAFISCKSLTSITINATTPPTLGNNAFNITNNCPIYVPAASVNAYKAASGWSTYSSRIQAIS